MTGEGASGLDVIAETKMVDVGTQTDLTGDMIQTKFMDESSFQPSTTKNTKKLTYYTGLPNLSIVLLILQRMDAYLTSIRITKLNNFQKLLITLMKLRLNCDFTHLSYLFDVRLATVSSLFKSVMIGFEYAFSDFIYWPQRIHLEAKMPSEFKLRFGNKVAVIIDCFEIGIEKPTMMNAQVKTFSSYKGKNTVKYLLGITPHGSISFLSRGYGGKASDKFITEDCGMLDKLSAGDIVLADRGFKIHELVAAKGASLVIPDFKQRNTTQLTPHQVENTRGIAHVRIHVERVIASIRNKFKLTQGPIPMTMLQETYEDAALIDYIMRSACILVNLCDGIVDVS